MRAFNKPGSLSNQLHKVILLLGVYALHLFLFLGLTVFSQSTYTGLANISAQAPHSSNHHDPASVECRSLFKYDDSKQQLNADYFPVTAYFHTHLYLNPSVVRAGIAAYPPFKLSDQGNKRYRLLQVFLI